MPEGDDDDCGMVRSSAPTATTLSFEVPREPVPDWRMRMKLRMLLLDEGGGGGGGVEDEDDPAVGEEAGDCEAAAAAGEGERFEEEDDDEVVVARDWVYDCTAPDPEEALRRWDEVGEWPTSPRRVRRSTLPVPPLLLPRGVPPRGVPDKDDDGGGGGGAGAPPPPAERRSVGAVVGGRGLAGEGSRRWAEEPRRPEGARRLLEDLGAQPSPPDPDPTAGPPMAVLGGGGGGAAASPLLRGVDAPFPDDDDCCCPLLRTLIVASRSTRSARNAVSALRSSDFSD